MEVDLEGGARPPNLMAGGPFAARLPCSACQQLGELAPADRIYEGSEDDRYRCARGHTFGIHWRQIPSRPLWAPCEPPTHQQIAEAAYQRFLARSAHTGDAVSDWLDAERDLRRPA